MLSEQTELLAATASDASKSDEDVKASIRVFLAAARAAAKDEVETAIKRLSEFLWIDNLDRVGLLAITCGSLVERGASPTALAPNLLKRYEEFLEDCVKVFDFIDQQVPKRDGEDDAEKVEQERGAALERAADVLPKQSDSWRFLQESFAPAIAVLSRSAELRAKSQRLRELSGIVSEDNQGAYWIALLLSVLENEPILVIEPATNIGMEGRISGIVDNFQLNTILMGSFPQEERRWFSLLAPKPRVSKSAYEIAQGLGPQSTNEHVVGFWNLYTWSAIEAGFQLNSEMDGRIHWVWNEGSPSDIPLFEGRRTILLGPRSYERFWNSQRMFDGLKASVTWERRLDASEVKSTLERMWTAKQRIA